MPGSSTAADVNVWSSDRWSAFSAKLLNTDCSNMSAGLLVGIDQSALVHNFKTVQQRVAPRQVCAVLKSDAYGHGIDNVVSAIAPACALYSVTETWEARRVRALAGDHARIFRMKIATSSELRDAIQHRLGVVEMAGSLGKARELSEVSRSLGVDTAVQLILDVAGLGRNGLPISSDANIAKDLDYLLGLPNLKIASIGAHIPNPDDCVPTDCDNVVVRAARRFLRLAGGLADHIAASGRDRPALDLFSSASSVALDRTLTRVERETLSFDRIGTSLYGNAASDAFQETGLRQVMHAFAPVCDVFRRPQGATIGYCEHYRVGDLGEDIALLGIGWQTLGREFQGVGMSLTPTFVKNLYNGTHFLVGRQSMNIITLRARDETGRTLIAGDLVGVLSSPEFAGLTGIDTASLSARMGDCQPEYITHLIGRSAASVRFSF
ncbi:hypothetical protein EI545_21185 (plasmid) [Tabrizicola piscis]|uniref:alanine racemase n=1 Tax=Tabrizicola piscis TaxID=2494374 RepID=A0A3S8UCX9_9RHOB|nr:alanine racemase [Tabrizicola piscis]AZL61470.1 hypothetical protein EI545_21185 [Tabrizicola piscis]